MKTFLLKLYMCSWVGVSKAASITSALLFISLAQADIEAKVDTTDLEWRKFAREVQRLKKTDYQNGLSYVISGSVALVGGIWGESITDDSVEKGVYTIFQSIGVASVGYGSYLWTVGGEERSLYDTLKISKKLSVKEKTHFLRAYYWQKKKKLRREKIIKAII